LWDHIDGNTEIEPQLSQVIANASNLEPWRAAIVKYPQVITYCGQQEIRYESADKIYLLSKRQMNGAHAELFSYVLNLELANHGANQTLAPLRLQSYQSVSMTEIEPHVILAFNRTGHSVSFAVGSVKSQFQIYTSCASLTELPEVDSVLRNEGKFSEMAGKLTRMVPRESIHDVLQQLAQTLANLPS
jgi:hypothetical protein